MHLVSYNQNNKQNIFIEGDIISSDDISSFQNTTNLNENLSLEITFIDGINLSSEVILRLIKLQNDFVEFELYVLKQFLRHYLLRLGINIKYNHKELSNLSQSDEETRLLNGNELDELLELVKNYYEYDFNHYQRATIARRVKNTMIKNSIKNFELFKIELIKSNELFYELFLDFSINVTKFFRTPKLFEDIVSIAKQKLEKQLHLKIWIAGCASGEEVYSIAMMLDTYNLLGNIQIYATDFNPSIIRVSKNGLYDTKSIENIEDKKYLKYFEQKDKNIYQIDNNIKEHILFYEHNLVSDGVFNKFDIILCQNVLIYFDKELQEKTKELFNSSLEIDGVIFLDRYGENKNEF